MSLHGGPYGALDPCGRTVDVSFTTSWIDMTYTVSNFIVQRLQAWGVERVYGYPGDGINGMMNAFRQAEQPRLIQTRHEEVAAFMASAHAKFTDTPGVCVSTSGPGAVHLLNGLYDAKKDHMPAVAILGQQSRASLGSDYQQELDLISLYKDVAGDYVHMVSVPAAVHHMLDQAMRTAMARRTVTAVILPNDIQDLPMAELPAVHGEAVFSGISYSKPQLVPPGNDLDAAAEVLNAGHKVAILAGAGCKHAVDEVLELASVLGAGIAKAVLAKTMFPDDVDYVTGTIGLLGTRPSQDMMNDCDTLLLIGTRFPYAEFLPLGDQARGVQIDIDAKALGLRFPTEVNLQGDTRSTVNELLKRVNYKSDRKWQHQLIKNTQYWWQLMADRAAVPADPINPQQVFWSLNQRLPINAILACDVGSATNWYARYLQVRRNMQGSLSGGLATMGNGVPYIIAAKFAFPERPGIAMVGDGAMQMLGNQALMDLAKYWREWVDPRCIVLVLNNQDLNQVTWEQRVMEGDPKFDASQDLPDFAYDEYAELLGLKGLRMSRPEDVDRVWNEALSADRPVVINAYTDPEVGPLPPHMSFGQAKGFMASMLKGDTDAGHTVRQTLRQATAAFRPNSRQE